MGTCSFDTETSRPQIECSRARRSQVGLGARHPLAARDLRSSTFLALRIRVSWNCVTIRPRFSVHGSLNER